jgi:hypothetical protein
MCCQNKCDAAFCWYMGKKFSKASRPPADAPIATMGESIAAVSDAVLDAAFFIGDGLTGAFF